MASQDVGNFPTDLGMLWYGVPGVGVSFNPADPAEVMLNTGTTAPLLSDHPRPLVPTPISFAETTAAQHTQMMYDPNTGDYITQPDYMYESYDGYDEDSSGSNVIHQQGTLPISDPGMVDNPEDSPPPVPKCKKPKVHQHPALKLKTPIAYQKDTDLKAIPIMREGMAVCEKCGAIGVKHAFYGKERKFCSLACARGPLPPTAQPLAESHVGVNAFCEEKKPMTMMKGVEQDSGVPLVPTADTTPNTTEIQPSQTVQPSTVLPETMSPVYLPPAESTVDLDGSFSWASTYLDDPNFLAVPVSCFKHAPMAKCWDQMSAGMKVEVACGEEAVTKDAFWVASVVAIAGYKAKLRFEGFVEDSSKDIWVDLCSEEVHPVGWCATQGRPLIPPRTIQHKYRDWKEFLMRRLTGARTLPTNFVSRVVESQKSRFRPGLNVEVVDKNRIAQMRVATVTEVVGKRLHLKYHGAPPDDNGFWCHEDAPIIHPVGWSREVGHEIVASQSYHEKCITGTYDPNDAPPELFVMTPTPSYLRNAKTSFSEGMKLEAIDPLNLSAICVATVMKVLHNNFLMIRIDSYESDNTCSDWFCYHATSPCIFPAGFCEMHNVTLTPPRGYEGQFSWFVYLKKTQAVAAPPALFNREVPSHGFEEGMALESADLMDPRLVCVATVKQVKGRLLKVHFDGWESDFDQWIDYQSADIYPVGWCDMSGYRLEGPKSENFNPLVQKRKVKSSGKFGKPGRRGRPLGSKKMKATAAASQAVSPKVVNPRVESSHLQAQRKRGRPPKEKLPLSETGFYGPPPDKDVDSADFSLMDEELPSSQRSRRSHCKKDARRSPRGSQGSHNRMLPTRALRTKAHPPSYNQSDEDDISDDTSSGVASLDGNESSRDPWDMDEKMCSVSSSPVPGEDATLTPSDMPEMEAQHSRELSAPLVDLGNPLITIESSFSLGSSKQNWGTNGNRESSRVPDNTQENVCKSVVANTPSTKTTVQQGVVASATVITGGVQVSQSQSPVVSSTSAVAGQVTGSKLCIPRIIDGPVKDGSKVQPKLWTAQDVAQFLKTNDCGAYCDNFISQDIQGSKLLSLSQNEVMGLTGKVGPSLKIHDLVQQLLALVNPAQARYQATLMKRGLPFT